MSITNGDELLQAMRSYQVPCVIAAAADLGIFDLLSTSTATGDALASELQCDVRATTILLDALATLGILEKASSRYGVTESLRPFLQDDSATSVLPMLRHQATCLRRWAQLPWTVQTGQPAADVTSVRGADADRAAFIQAMHVVSRDVAGPLVGSISPGGVRCVLDVGGATGSWTMAWLDAEPDARAILFDLPDVQPLAERRLADAGYLDRVQLVAGDFYTDDLPTGADLAWVSAIIHQNSRVQNRDLFQRIAAAVEPNGWIYIRDIVMDDDHTSPVAGAIFAVNMLSATAAGGTFSLAEIRADLEASGFAEVTLVQRHEAMHSIVRARVGG